VNGHGDYSSIPFPIIQYMLRKNWYKWRM